MDVQVGRAISAVGVVLALVAIWVDAIGGRSYWDRDGTIGWFLLVMVVAAGLAVAVWRVRKVIVVGGILLGFYGFLPAQLATDHWGVLDAGAWLGLSGAALIVLGGLLVAAPEWLDAPARARGFTLPAWLAIAGLVLCLVAIWPDSLEDGSYFDAPLFGHSLGALMLLLLIVAAAGIAGATLLRNVAAAGIAAVAGSVLWGLFLYVPVGAAFNQLGLLRAGAWLGLFGGLLLVGGTRRMLPRGSKTG